MATINGTSRNDHLRGTRVADMINGFGGNDRIDGRQGADRLDGGAGNDTYLIDSTGDVVIEKTNSGSDTVIVNVRGQDGYFLPEDVENAKVSGFFSIVGNDLPNVITRIAPAGADGFIEGGAGNDKLFGGAGDDQFVFGPDQYAVGHDVVNGRGGENALSIGGTSPMTIDFRNGTAGGQGDFGAWSVKFTNIERALGGIGNDVLIADSSGVTLNGMAGNDTVRGGSGRDFLIGDPGDDIVTGGGGNDTVFGGIGADRLDGGKGNDLLVWDSEDLRLNGGSGTDTLKLPFIQQADINLTAIPDGVITGVERLDMRGGTNTFTLGEQDLLALSSTTNTLKVFGDAVDQVNIVGAFSSRGSSGGFDHYKVGSGWLLVDGDIAVT